MQYRLFYRYLTDDTVDTSVAVFLTFSPPLSFTHTFSDRLLSFPAKLSVLFTIIDDHILYKLISILCNFRAVALFWKGFL